ncbi:DNA-binding protein [Streptomyces sp. MNU76]|uniref:PPC domain-containing DNA-binding protein n=1 Tax=Streptomyces sp. MNU76 TaxID=2560026 RepID=UPI001E3004AC|nr:PPC domain-containing DNA-binding protein [Streptomyces sp. MNU76]MCC9711771.1 DNA-binding protein [Streptomyces sp. MNU76]
MDVQPEQSPRFYLVRLEPGEDIADSLCLLAKEYELPAMAIASAVGSVEKVVYSTAIRDSSGTPAYSKPRRHEGCTEIGSLQGHVGYDLDEVPFAHLHGVFASSEGGVFAGHVHEARVLVTVELGLIAASSALWRRQPLHGFDGNGLAGFHPVFVTGPQCSAQSHPADE